MARMLSLLASGIRGSIGGLTFFSGPYHQIQVRQRTAPVQPNTTYQAYIKNHFGSAVALWESLDQDDRDAWAQYAQTVTFQGPLGSYSPTGRSLAIGMYSAARYVAQVSTGTIPMTIDMEPPVLSGQIAISGITVGPPTAPGIGNSITVGNIGNGEQIWCYANKSFVQSDSRNFFKGPFRADTFQSEFVAEDASDAFEFSSGAVGHVYFVRIRALSSASPFRMSPLSIVRCIAEETVV